VTVTNCFCIGCAPPEPFFGACCLNGVWESGGLDASIDLPDYIVSASPVLYRGARILPVNPSISLTDPRDLDLGKLILESIPLVMNHSHLNITGPSSIQGGSIEFTGSTITVPRTDLFPTCKFVLNVTDST